MISARPSHRATRPAVAAPPSLLALLVTGALAAGCDDPAPAGPATTAPPAASSPPPTASASARASASVAAAPSAPATGAAGSASAPPEAASPPPGEAGAATTGAAAAPPPRAAAATAARTGILRPGEADKILARGQTSKVRVLDAGAEPREPLRYALVPGRTTPLEMGLTMTLELTQGARSVPAQTIPRITTLLDLVTSAAPAGGATGVEVIVRDVGIGKDSGLPQQVADRLLPHLQGVKGLTLGYQVTPDGRVKQAAAKLPGGGKGIADPTLQQMSQSLESMIAPFPEDAVGIGARWEVVARFDSSGTELVQWSTFELRSRDEGGAHLGLTVVQAAAQPEVQPPNLPPGVTARLSDFSSRGAGESRVDLSSPAPRSATMKVESAMTLAVAQGGAPSGEATSMKSTMLVELAQKAPAGGASAAPPAGAP